MSKNLMGAVLVASALLVPETSHASALDGLKVAAKATTKVAKKAAKATVKAAKATAKAAKATAKAIAG